MRTGADFTKKKAGTGSGLCLALAVGLLDGQPLVRAGCALGQGQLEDAFVEFGGCLGVVDFLTQLEGARNLAEVAFGAQDALAFLDFFFLLDLLS